MSKRKAVNEKNLDQVQRPVPRRSSNASLHRTSNVVQHRSPRIVEAQSNQNFTARRKACIRGDAMTNCSVQVLGTPKTRFTSEDKQMQERCTVSSPRLKSFPAEKMKRLDDPLLFSPRAKIVRNDYQQGNAYTLGEGQGYGDMGEQMIQHRQQHAMQGFTMDPANQQSLQYAPVQLNPRSESALANQPTSPTKQQPHRAFVPNRYATMTPRPSVIGSGPYSEQNIPTTHTASQGQEFVSGEMDSNPSKAGEDGWLVDDMSIVKSDYEKQPVGGRNAHEHRRMLMQQKEKMKQPQEPQAAMSTPHNLPIQVYPPAELQTEGQNYYQNNNLMASKSLDQQNPQEVYQQLQRNINSQQQMQQRAVNHHLQMMNSQQRMHQQMQPGPGNCHNYYTQQQMMPGGGSYGMTSPQDVAMTRYKNTQNMVRSTPTPSNGSLGYQQMMGQNDWMDNTNSMGNNPNTRAHLAPYTVDVMAPGAQVNQQQQAVMPYQHQMYTQQQYIMPVQQTNVADQSHKKVNPIVRSNDQQNTSNKQLQFTPAMIHDQELLMNTMKQQGIAEDLMRRQFDGLLNEQRKQLLYHQQLEQLQNEEPSVTERTKTRSKITRISDWHADEKPEWMVHITPPRPSYVDYQKQRANRAKARRQEDEMKDGGTTSVQNMTPQQSPNDQFVHQQQMHPQYSQNPSHHHQEQNAGWQQCGNQHRGNELQQYNYQSQPHPQYQNSYNPGAYQYQASWNPQYQQQQEYYHQQQYQQQQQRYIQQQQQYHQQNWQNHQLQNLETSVNVKNPVNNESYVKDRPIEASSLLKLRVYKNTIRPQRRNNGLQDPEIIQKSLEYYNDDERRKGMEYLANVSNKKPLVKLNGTQNPNEVPPEFIQMHPINSQPQMRVPANGLENTRNPNNPRPHPPTQSRGDNQVMLGYPRQRMSNPRNCYNVQAERENGTTQQQSAPAINWHQQQYSDSTVYNHKNALSGRNNVMAVRYTDQQPQYYQQGQKYDSNKQNWAYANNGQGDYRNSRRSDLSIVANANRAGGDTSEGVMRDFNDKSINNKTGYIETMQNNGYRDQQKFHEAKTIGGISYLGTKPEYVTSNSMMQQYPFTASKYMQPVH